MLLLLEQYRLFFSDRVGLFWPNTLRLWMHYVCECQLPDGPIKCQYQFFSAAYYIRSVSYTHLDVYKRQN